MDNVLNSGHCSIPYLSYAPYIVKNEHSNSIIHGRAMLTFNSTKMLGKSQISIKSQPTFSEANCLGKKPDSRKLASKKPTWQPWLKVTGGSNLLGLCFVFS